MNPKIIFEDKHLLVLDKPPGWIVNEAETTKDQPVVQTWLAKNHNFPTVDSKKERSGIVHRIDKETSGLLIVGKTSSAYEFLQKQFKHRKVKKTYTALLHGELVPKEGVVNVPVGRLTWNRERFGVIPGGRSAKTKYSLAGYYKKDKETLSLTQFYPITGRTHQIRIHAKYLKHPIVSDEFYAGRKTARNDRVWCPRLFLHASEIMFVHPKSRLSVSYTSKLPEDLQGVLDLLKKPN